MKSIIKFTILAIAWKSMSIGQYRNVKRLWMRFPFHWVNENLLRQYLKFITPCRHDNLFSQSTFVCCQLVAKFFSFVRRKICRNRFAAMEYYLVDEENLSFTIVRESVLVVEEYEILVLEKGSKIKFLYPEGSQAANEYEGTIIAISKSEAELVNIRKEEVWKYRSAVSGKVKKRFPKRKSLQFSVKNFCSAE